MKGKTAGGITALVFSIAALGIGALFFFPEKFSQAGKGGETRQPRIISPLAPAGEDFSQASRRLAPEDRLMSWAALGEGEIMIIALNGDFDGDPQEEQIIAYRYPPQGPDKADPAPRNSPEPEEPIHIAYIDYDEDSGGYRRVWSAPTAATRPLTFSLYTQDLIGDRSVCVLASGMNAAGEHTLTVFRKGGDGALFDRIAEFRIDGAISVQETERTQAYRLGLARGQSFPIVAYSRDQGSGNILDQVETVYTYNEGRGLYEQSKVTRIPGKELEQRRVRELLSGSAASFEDFISGLWYYVSPQGTLDSRQYIYFDPASRELIFYGDETQQVFTWQNSSATRYGLYISTQNISVTTLRRFLDIELESLDSIRVKVFEDVRLKIGVNAPWDGSYRKAGSPGSGPSGEAATVSPYRDGLYEGSIGRIRFSPDGFYELAAGGNSRRGRYVFFPLDKREALELRPAGPAEGEQYSPAAPRETYLVEVSAEGEEGGERLILRRIRLGVQGIEELREPPLSLSAVN